MHYTIATLSTIALIGAVAAAPVENNNQNCGGCIAEEQCYTDVDIVCTIIKDLSPSHRKESLEKCFNDGPWMQHKDKLAKVIADAEKPKSELPARPTNDKETMPADVDLELFKTKNAKSSPRPDGQFQQKNAEPLDESEDDLSDERDGDVNDKPQGTSRKSLASLNQKKPDVTADLEKALSEEGDGPQNAKSKKRPNGQSGENNVDPVDLDAGLSGERNDPLNGTSRKFAPLANSKSDQKNADVLVDLEDPLSEDGAHTGKTQRPSQPKDGKSSRPDGQFQQKNAEPLDESEDDLADERDGDEEGKPRGTSKKSPARPIGQAAQKNADVPVDAEDVLSEERNGPQSGNTRKFGLLSNGQKNANTPVEQEDVLFKGLEGPLVEEACDCLTEFIDETLGNGAKERSLPEYETLSKTDPLVAHVAAPKLLTNTNLRMDNQKKTTLTGTLAGLQLRADLD